jgi:hypothetical protein
MQRKENYHITFLANCPRKSNFRWRATTPLYILSRDNWIHNYEENITYQRTHLFINAWHFAASNREHTTRNEFRHVLRIRTTMLSMPTPLLIPPRFSVLCHKNSICRFFSCGDGQLNWLSQREESRSLQRQELIGQLLITICCFRLALPNAKQKKTVFVPTSVSMYSLLEISA